MHWNVTAPRHSDFLLATQNPDLLRHAESAARACSGQPLALASADALLNALAPEQPPALVLLDTCLPGMETSRLLAALRAHPAGAAVPIVLFSDTLTGELRLRIEENVLSDVLPHAVESEFLALRLEQVLRSHAALRELDRLREFAAVHAYQDPLTGTYNRSMLLSLLFRETDRAQRMNTSLCMILFDIDDFGHWNLRLGAEACDTLLAQAAGRASRLLRSYDLLGRMGNDEFLAALPGCSAVNAVLLAERIRSEVFSEPFQVADKAIRLSACFSVGSSQGRSPVVVLRELEEGLRAAKCIGPETIQRVAEWPKAQAEPVAFLSPTSGNDLLAW